MGKQFTLEWTLANGVGLVIGSLLGATDTGFLPGVVGDVALGGSIGAAQAVVIARHIRRGRWLLLWVAVTALGYALGVVLGRRFSGSVTHDHLLMGIVFGIFVGVCISPAQWLALRMLPGIALRKAALWLPISLTAWILAEFVAFVFYFRLETTPLVGLTLGIVTAAAWPLMASSNRRRFLAFDR